MPRAELCGTELIARARPASGGDGRNSRPGYRRDPQDRCQSIFTRAETPCFVDSSGLRTGLAGCRLAFTGRRSERRRSHQAATIRPPSQPKRAAASGQPRASTAVPRLQPPEARADPGDLDPGRLRRACWSSWPSSPGSRCWMPCTSEKSTSSTCCTRPSGPGTKARGSCRAPQADGPRGRRGAQPARQGAARRPGDGRADRQAGPGRGRAAKQRAPARHRRRPRPGPGRDLGEDRRHGRLGRRPGALQRAHRDRSSPAARRRDQRAARPPAPTGTEGKPA